MAKNENYNNILVNETVFKKNSNKKGWRLVKGALSVIVAASVGLGSFAIVKQFKNKEALGETPDASSTTYSQDNNFVSYDEYINLEDNAFTSISMPMDTNVIAFDELDYNEFINYLDQMETEYYEEDLFGIDEALAAYQNSFVAGSQHDNLEFLGRTSLTSEELYEQVKKNNKEYLNSGEFESNFVDELDSKQLKEITAILADEINYYIATNPNVDASSVMCFLSDLKIFSDSSINNARVTEDKCMNINYSMIDLSRKMYPNVDVFKAVIHHEGQHMMQPNCCDAGNIKADDAYSICARWDNLKTNPLYWSWALDAVATKNTMDRLGEEAIDYPILVRYLETIKQSAIIRNDNTTSSYEDIFFTTDLNSFFNYFGCETLDQKVEIIKMMYSLEIMQKQDAGFYELYSQKYGIDNVSQEVMDDVNYRLKASICETLTKIFYKNLAQEVYQSKLTYQNAFYMISLFEATLNAHLQYTNLGKADYNLPFIDKYLEIQNNFFAFIADDNKYTQAEIESLYENYAIYCSNGDNTYFNNCDLTQYSDKKAYFEKRVSDLGEFSNVSIGEAKAYIDDNTFTYS